MSLSFLAVNTGRGIGGASSIGVVGCVAGSDKEGQLECTWPARVVKGLKLTIVLDEASNILVTEV